jgi:hypothetical protein
MILFFSKCQNCYLLCKFASNCILIRLVLADQLLCSSFAFTLDWIIIFPIFSWYMDVPTDLLLKYIVCCLLFCLNVYHLCLIFYLEVNKFLVNEHIWCYYICLWVNYYEASRVCLFIRYYVVLALARQFWNVVVVWYMYADMVRILFDKSIDVVCIVAAQCIWYCARVI